MRFAVELVPRVFAPFVRSACGVELDMGQCQFRGVNNGQRSPGSLVESGVFFYLVESGIFGALPG